MTEPSWIARARTYIGVHETAGPHHNPTILKFLDEADGKAGDGKTLQGIRDDETPWCASFISAILEEAGIISARSAWARSYLNWGQPLKGAAVGAVAVMGRNNDPNSGHVTFVVGRDKAGNLLCLGGNQADSVKISAFSPARVLGYRWPKTIPLPAKIGVPNLPVLNSAGLPSTNEA